MEVSERTGTVVSNMPELPEVETIKNVLKALLVGRTIKSIDVLRKATIEGDHNVFVSKLTGQSFTNVSRIGKYLVFHLTPNNVFLSHLRMEGKYFEYDEKEHNSPYAKVVFHLTDGKKICYDDSRGFGSMHLTNEENWMNEKEIKKLGPEPYDANANELYKRNNKSNIAIKTTILDQTLMCGIGNIYADETLYESKIHPHTPARLITLEQWETIRKNACNVLTRAIKMGGSTIKSYHPGKNIDGKFQRELKIYGKAGEICPICGKEFIFTKTNGRGTTFCPGCQHKIGKPITVGLTGKIASGKSYVSRLFSSEGFEIISCDDIVNEIYQDPRVIDAIRRGFNLPFENEINRKMLRDYLLTHDKSKNRLERLIYPLVIKEVESRLKKTKSSLVVVEAPTLFRAHMENMFSTIIIVDVDNKSQLERLEKRVGIEAAKLMLEINKDCLVDESKNKAEFLVSNTTSKEDCEMQINQIINTLKCRLG